MMIDDAVIDVIASQTPLRREVVEQFEVPGAVLRFFENGTMLANVNYTAATPGELLALSMRLMALYKAAAGWEVLKQKRGYSD